MPPLNQDQARRLYDQLGPMLAHLTRLVARFEIVGYRPADPYYIQAAAARHAVFDLHTCTHALACGGKWDSRKAPLGALGPSRERLSLPFVG